MSTGTHYLSRLRLFLLLIGLSLVLQLPDEPARAAHIAYAAPLQPSSVTLIMSNPACVQVAPTSGICAIEIGNLSAYGSDPTFSRIEVSVNGKLRVYVAGFFESTAYLAHSMMPGGLRVVCGRPGDGGSPDYGKAYVVAANAYMADASSANVSQTVYCPSFEEKDYIPLIRK